MTARILILDIEGYVIYSDGKVFSRKRNRFLQPWPNMFGYLTLKLKNKNVLLHRLLAESFMPNPFGLETVDHIDENKLNNDISNLRWMTREENAGRSGRGVYTLISPDGGIYTFKGLNEFCRDMGLSQPNVSKVLKGIRPSHKGWTTNV